MRGTLGRRVMTTGWSKSCKQPQQVSDIDISLPRDKMVENVITYLKTAAHVITNIHGQSWMCFRWCHYTNDTRAAVYWSLAAIIFVLMGLVYA